MLEFEASEKPEQDLTVERSAIDWYGCVYKTEDKGYATLTVLPISSSIGEGRLYLNDKREMAHMHITHSSRLDHDRQEDLVYKDGKHIASRSRYKDGSESLEFSMDENGKTESYTLKRGFVAGNGLFKAGKEIAPSSSEYALAETKIQELSFDEPKCQTKVPGF